MFANNFPFRASAAREYIIQIRRTSVDHSRAAHFGSLARTLLRSVVPDRVHSGSLDLPELRACAFVVYALEGSDDTIQSLSEAWKDMSSSQRKSVVEQVLDCRAKLGKIKFDWPEEGCDPEEDPIPRLAHPLIAGEELSEYTWLAPRRAHAKGLWKLSHGLRSGDQHHNEALACLPSTLALLEPYVKGSGNILGEGDSVWLSPEAQGSQSVKFSWRDLKHRETLDRNTLQHRGLFPVNIMVTKSRWACNLPSKYKVTSILGWDEASFIPIGYDAAVQDARVGYPDTGDADGTYYDKVRSESAKTALRAMALCETPRGKEVKIPAAAEALRRLLAAAQTFSADKERSHPPSEHERWLRNHRYSWSGVEKGYTRKLLRPC